VFGNEVGEPVKSIKTAWRATCRRAVIEGLQFHDLRRECGWRLLESPGVALPEVSAWLGHQNVTTTNAYLAATAQRLKATARKLEIGRTRRTRVAHGAGSTARPHTSARAAAAEKSVS
jgi:integrase